jgi:hypothetical protein
MIQTVQSTPPETLLSRSGRLWLALDLYVGVPVPMLCRATLADHSPAARLADVGPTATIQDCGS